MVIENGWTDARWAVLCTPWRRHKLIGARLMSSPMNERPFKLVKPFRVPGPELFILLLLKTKTDFCTSWRRKQQTPVFFFASILTRQLHTRHTSMQRMSPNIMGENSNYTQLSLGALGSCTVPLLNILPTEVRSQESVETGSDSSISHDWMNHVAPFAALYFGHIVSFWYHIYPKS